MSVVGRLVYRDDEIEVYSAPREEEVAEYVARLVAARGRVGFRELREMLSGVVGEDRLRRILRELEATGVVVLVDGTVYSLEEGKRLLREREARRRWRR